MYRSCTAVKAPCKVMRFLLIVFPPFSSSCGLIILLALTAVRPSSDRAPPWAITCELALPLGGGVGGGSEGMGVDERGEER